MKNKSVFERYLDALQKAGDATLRWQYQKDMMKMQFFSKEEYERIVSDVAEEVISRIKLSVDASEIIDAIDEIERRLKMLER